MYKTNFLETTVHFYFVNRSQVVFFNCLLEIVKVIIPRTDKGLF